MNDFKNAYQSAVQDMDKLGMKHCHIDASTCMDEGRHRRRMMKRMRRTMTTAFSAMCVIFICGFGTVKAAEYIDNVIKVNQWGFESADAMTMARNEGQNSRTYVVQDSIEFAIVETEEESVSIEDQTMPELQMVEQASVEKVSVEEQSTPIEDARIEEPSAPVDEVKVEEQPITVSEPAVIEAGDSLSVESQEAVGGETDQMQGDGNAMMKQPAADIEIERAEQDEKKKKQITEEQPGIAPVSETEGLAAAGTQENAPVMTEMPIEELAMETATVEEIPTKNYVSWEEFEKYEDIIFPQPSISVGKTIEATDITVCGDWAMVRYDVDGKVLWIERTDYSNTQGHASSKVFPGGVCNERTYTTPAGYTYTLIDSVKESKDEPLQIHAAISVGSYEAYIDFMGYTEEDAKKIMDSIDLSVYE